MSYSFFFKCLSISVVNLIDVVIERFINFDILSTSVLGTTNIKMHFHIGFKIDVESAWLSTFFDTILILKPMLNVFFVVVSSTFSPFDRVHFFFLHYKGSIFFCHISFSILFTLFFSHTINPMLDYWYDKTISCKLLQFKFKLYII